MVEDNLKLEEKILKSPFIVDQGPHRFLARGKIWNIRRWKTSNLMLEVK